MKTLLTTAAVALVAGSASAATLADYDYATGADPTGQGWTLTGGNGQWNSAHDNGAAWEINDGTSSGLTYYSQGYDASAVTSWTMSTSMSLQSDLTGQDSTVLSNWHLTDGRSTGHTLWVENATSGYLYIVQVGVVAGELVLTDGTTSTVLDAAFAFDSAFDLAVTYDGTSAEASYNGGTGISVASSGSGGTDRIIFGQTGSSPMGSAAYSDVSFSTAAVPEPSSTALLGLGGLALIMRRRK